MQFKRKCTLVTWSQVSENCCLPISEIEISQANQLDIGLMIERRNHLENEVKLDILLNAWKQPPGFNFPSTHVNGKLRRYLTKWEEDYSWLRYAPSSDGAFCAPCFVFGTASANANELFQSTPFRDWKNAKGSIQRSVLERHHRSMAHLSCVERAENFLAIQTGNTHSVAAMIDQQRLDKIKANKTVIEALTGIILLCAKRGWALRGNWNNEKGAENSNFMSLVEWTATYSKELENHLKIGAKNAQ